MKVNLHRYFILVFALSMLCFNAQAQDVCEIVFELGQDTVRQTNDVACVTLSTEGFTGLASFELSMSYDSRDLVFLDLQNDRGRLSGIEVMASSGNLIIKWSDPEALISTGAGDLIDLCFTVINLPQQKMDIIFSGENLRKGNSASSGNNDLRICTLNGVVNTTCSIRQLEFNERWSFRESVICRNDTLGTNYMYQQHPLSDFPMTFETIRNGIPYSTIVYPNTDFPDHRVPNPIIDGSYRIVLTTAEGCSVETNFVVQRYGDMVNNVRVTHFNGIHELSNTCSGINDGTFATFAPLALDSAILSNGQVVYPGPDRVTYSVDSLSPGNYTIQATDLLGCISEQRFEIKDIPTYNVYTDVFPATCDGQDGAAWVSFDDNQSYDVTWDGFATTGPLLDDLSPGTYTATIVNQEGCIVTKEINVGMTGFIDLEWETDVSYQSCQLPTMASRTVSIKGANITDATFIWSSGEQTMGNSSTAMELTTGAHWVVAQTSTCQSDTLRFEVDDIEPFEASIDLTNSQLSVCRNELGSVQITYVGTVPPRILDESDNDVGLSFEVPSGTYSYKAVNDNGCEIPLIFEVITLGDQFEFEGGIPDELCEDQVQIVRIKENAITPSITLVTVDGVEVSLDQDIELRHGTTELYIETSSACPWRQIFTIGKKEFDVQLPASITLNEGENGIIRAITSDEDLEFEWNTLLDVNCLNTTCSEIEILASQSDTIKVMASTPSGCLFQDSIIVTVNESIEASVGDFYVPNIIDLNSTLNNDICIHPTNDIVAIESFLLFNRWGNLVAQQSSSDNEVLCLLQESQNVDQIISGVYVYLLKLQLRDGTMTTQAGDVTIIK